MKSTVQWIIGAAMLLLVAFLAPPSANAQDPSQAPAQAPLADTIMPPAPSPDYDSDYPLGTVIEMARSGADENEILATIRNSSVPFNASAPDMEYLNDLGMPAAVEAALIERDKELGASATSQAPPPAWAGQDQEPQDVSEDYFYDALAPYGTWTNLAGYGLCWRPCAATYDPGWTPYCTSGQWIYTDSGWYWLSGYSWGWSVFHYGRWFHDARLGWCWWPSTTWGPSWVFWRYSNNDAGWAPLPPHCYYSEEHGLLYNGVSIESDYNFGIGSTFFCFVPMANIFDVNPGRFRLATSQSAQVFAQSEVLVAINSNDRVIVNDGIPIRRFAPFIGGMMRSFTIHSSESVAQPGTRGEQILPDGETLAINRPYFVAYAPSALKEGIAPLPEQEQPVAHQPPTYIVNQIPYSYPSDDEQNNNNVIYVSSASQYGPPVPTVTLAGPQDYAGAAPAVPCPAQSFWVVPAEPPPPIDIATTYMSPRMQSRERWHHKVREAADHQEFNPPAGGNRPGEHQNSHKSVTDLGRNTVQLLPSGRIEPPADSHPATASSPGHDRQNSPPSGHGH